MDNPSKAAKRAEMEDLLEAQVACNKAARISFPKHKAADENSEELDSDSWETLKLHMNRIYSHHLVNTKYNRHLLVYLDQQWAHYATQSHKPFG
ncbi:hypothetical protein VP01_2096g2 [Puccinia sorghi]|uniref:Uncharacterized protein n=1 Tax=Puccinia sorghi TaxID=27349 RepID=A0A0L6VAG0_9BASI|nr:hypothetical protein VP01_2096g2 [Puccinia sorghi]